MKVRSESFFGSFSTTLILYSIFPKTQLKNAKKNSPKKWSVDLLKKRKNMLFYIHQKLK